MLERECPVCQRTYIADPQRLKHGRQTTCSRACSYALRGQAKAVSSTEPCGVCGTRVTRPPSRQARARCATPLCSKTCHYRARKLGLVGRVLTKPMCIPQHTRAAQAERMRAVNTARKQTGNYSPAPEVRGKISLGVAKAIAEGRISRVSRLEVEVGAILQALGVRALPQYALHDEQGRFAAVLDYFLPDFGVALEVNGTYWHSDPRAYPNGPVKPSQHRVAGKYARKVGLLHQRGVPLAEVWEIDFRADPQQAVRDALSAWLP